MRSATKWGAAGALVVIVVLALLAWRVSAPRPPNRHETGRDDLGSPRTEPQLEEGTGPVDRARDQTSRESEVEPHPVVSEVGTISGLVRNDAGDPVKDAVVRATVDAEWRDRIRLEARPERTTTADAAGRFEFPDCPCVPHEVRASGQRLHYAVRESVATATPPSDIELVMARELVVRGTVRDQDGAPVVSATVGIGYGKWQWTTSTNARGEFRMTLSSAYAGNWSSLPAHRVYASKRGFEPVDLPLEVRQNTVLEITLPELE